MEEILKMYPNVDIQSQLGNLYITHTRVFWLAQGTSNQMPYQFLIKDWLKSEKSNKTPRVRLSLSSGPSPLVLGFQDGRTFMEEFCQILQDKHTNSKKEILPTYTLLLPHQLVDLTLHISSLSQSTQVEPISIENKLEIEQPVSKLTQPVNEETQPVSKPAPKPVTYTPIEPKPKQSIETNIKGTSGMNQVIISNANEMADERAVMECYKKTLDENSDLRYMYSYLVGPPELAGESKEGKLISPADFWNLHSLEVAQALTMPAANQNGFLAYPPTFEVFQGSTTVLHGRSDMMQTIIKEDENVRKIYDMSVRTGKMTAESFWERFFQSRYFYEFVGKSTSGKKHWVEEIGGYKLSRSDEKLQTDIQQDVATLSDSVVELISSDANHKRGFGTIDGYSSYTGDISDNPDRLKSNNSSTLLNRFNRQSNKLVNEFAPSYKHPHTNQHFLADNRNEKVSKELEMEDLVKPKAIQHPILELTRQQLYASSSKHTEKQTDQFSQTHISTHKNNIEELRKTIFQQRPMGKIEPDNTMYETGRHMFIFNTKLCHSEKLTQVASLDYDSQTVSSVKAHQSQVIELLQHFYCSKIPEEQKRSKIMNALEQTKNDLLTAQESLFNRVYAGGSAKALYAPIIEMIDIARTNDTRIKNMISELRAKRRKAK